ncbi:MAG: serine/threonine transporter SstT [Bacteroidales bacterium]|nr:serine/threonine transporter SstT [Bacteroidales bacterium]
MLKWWTGTSLVLRILSGVVIGSLLGLFLPGWTGIGILGTVFVSALKALAPVLVAVLVMSSIAKAGKGLGSRFKTVILLYLGATFSAALVAVSASFVFPVTLDLKDAAQAAAPGTLSEVFAGLLTNMVHNPLMAVSTANYIGILFWAIIIGLALKIKASETTLRVVGDLAEVVSMAITWVIQFAPFGIMGLVFTSVSEGGLDIFTTYGKLLLMLVGCMLFTWAIVNPLIHFLLLGTNPYPLLWACLKESGVNAFFTRSSAANIPINMALCKKLGLNEEFYSVSIPLGATINMSGAAVTITVLSLAVAHTMGIEVSFGAAVVLSLVATLGACGASGVAGGSLLLVPMACSFFGISADIAMQAVAVGFIIGVVQDSVETALNSSSDVFFTATAEMRDRKKI